MLRLSGRLYPSLEALVPNIHMHSSKRPRLTQLVERFGTARDTWIAADLNSWLAPNRIYSGVADVLRNLKQREDVYIVTTKQVNSTPFPSDCDRSLPLGIHPLSILHALATGRL